MPGPKTGVHGLACLFREGPQAPMLCCGLECSCDVESARACAVTPPGRWWCRTWTSLRWFFLCSSACGSVPLFPGLLSVVGVSVVSDLFLRVGLATLGRRRVASCRPSILRVVARALCGGVRPVFWLGASVVDGLRSRVPAGRDGFPHCLCIRAVLRHLRVAGCPPGGEICGM